MFETANDKIDFVILWVDGNDPKWQEEKRKYIVSNDADDSIVRYADWDNLNYWFRGIEKYAPWVNRIHFVTYGHLPKWLNVNHPKLNIVNHKDFIPLEFLPTFNSHTIELNMHRINGLSERFIYFNDDMFIINKVKSDDFFKNGKTRDRLILNVISPNDDLISNIIFNNIKVINRNFEKKIFFKRNFFKLIYPFYGREGIKNILNLPYKLFTGFQDDHIPYSYTKTLFQMIWDKEYDVLYKTCSNRFRNKEDVNQWLFRYWNLVYGNIIPCSSKHGRLFTITNDNDKMYKAIKTRKYKMICCNDSGQYTDFSVEVKKLKDVFEQILPDKSAFEI